MKDFDDLDEEFSFVPDFNPDDTLWSAFLTFPRPSKLTDEQMQIYFPHHDGKWSAETKSALKLHDAQGLDLNDNWAMARRSWTCPSCNRTKNEIFRLSKKNILLAKLELHHDHASDDIIPRLRGRFGENWREQLPAGYGDTLDALEILIRRFDLCLVCSECNSADGAVKRKYREKIDPRFSFSVSEISQFISAKPHREHSIDFEAAHEIWEQEREGFFARLKMVDDLLDQLSKGYLVQEKFGAVGINTLWNFMSQSTLLQKAFNEDTSGTGKRHLLSNFCSEFLARSTSRDTAGQFIPQIKKNGVSPTDQEFKDYVDPVSTKRWHQTPDSWECPICNRSKRQILRKSNKGKWTGGIRSHTELIDESDPITISKRRVIFPDYPNRRWVSGVKSTDICSDCSGIGSQVAQKDRTIRDPYLTIHDLQDCLIEAAPNERHIVDVELARERIAYNAAYETALDAFHSFQALISKFQLRMTQWRNAGMKRGEIISDLIEDLRVYHNIADRTEGLELVEWILGRKEKSD